MREGLSVDFGEMIGHGQQPTEKTERFGEDRHFLAHTLRSCGTRF